MKLCLSLLSSILVALSFSTEKAAAQAPYGLRTIATRENPTSVLYDPTHARFYAAVPGENSIYVLAEATWDVVTRIQINAPGQMSLSPDSAHLYVATSLLSLGQAGPIGYYDVDTTSLRVVDYVQTVVNNTNVDPRSLNFSPDRIPVSLAALSSGKVLFVGEAVDVSGGAIFVSDLTTRLATQSPDANFFGGVVAGSRDGSTAVLASINSATVQLELRGADGSLSASLNFSTLNSSDIAISSDGQTVALGGKYLFTNKFAQMATLPAISMQRSVGSVFSPDNSRLYVLVTPDAAQSPEVAVFSTASRTLLGYIPLPAPPKGIVPQAIAAGSSGKILVATARALIELDAANPIPGLTSGSSPSPVTLSPNAGVAGSPAPVSISYGVGKDPKVYFGQTAAAVISSVDHMVTVQPPSSTSGSVSVSLLFSDGSLAAALSSYSYGPSIRRTSVTAGAIGGGTIVTLYGQGLGTSTNFPTVTIGGTAATVTDVRSFNDQDIVTFKTPAGKTGLADLTLTSYAGSVTQPGAFLYCPHSLIPSVLPYQMVTDNLRNQLYVADSTTASVLAIDGTTFAVRTLIHPASPPTSLALTPDGATLLVLSRTGDTLDLIDLATGNHGKTLIPNPGGVSGAYSPNTVVATARGTALVSLRDNGLLAGTLVEVSLSTGAVSPVRTGARFGKDAPSTLLAANLAGDKITMTMDSASGISGGATDQWQAALDGPFFETSQTSSALQLATDDLGDITLQDSNALDAQLNQFSNLAPDLQLAASRDRVYGEALHSSGALAYVPTTQGLELMDIHHGNTVLSIGVPEGSLKGRDNLAISHSGSRLYVAQPNGIGVFDLPAVPLSIGSLTPASGPAAGGTAIVLRGSGFAPSTAVTLDGKPAAVTYLDSTQLSFVSPAVSAAKVSVAVTESGVAYSLDAAFDASVYPVPLTPVLVSIAPSNVQVATSSSNNLITGSNFNPGTQFFLNGSLIASSFLSSTQAFTAYNAIAGPGKQAVTAVNPPNPGVSNPIFITTYSAGFSINSTDPSSVAAGSGAFTLRIYANSILPDGAAALWNGAPLASTRYGDNYLYVSVPAALIASTGTASLTVAAPGFAVSNAIPFSITPASAPAPATASVLLSPSLLTFPAVLVGNTSSAMLILTSNGTAAAVIASITTGGPIFSQTNTCSSPLAPGQSCSILVTFKPTSFGTSPGVLTVNSNAPSVSASEVGPAGDLALNSTAPTAVTAGQSATATITAATSGTFPGTTLQIACTSGLPAGALCQFNPSPVVIAAVSSGTTYTNVALTITTSAGTRVMLDSPFGQRTVFFAGLLLGTGLLRRLRRFRVTLLTLSGLVLTTALLACGAGAGSNGGGGGGNGGGTLTGNTPAGTYAVTVTTTSGGNVHTTVVNLTVQ